MRYITRINSNKVLKKLSIFLSDNRREYLGYVDSVYYDTAGNSNISNLFEYPDILSIHGELIKDADDFFKAIFIELRKHVKTFTVNLTRRNAVKFLLLKQQEFGIKLITVKDSEITWAFY